MSLLVYNLDIEMEKAHKQITLLGVLLLANTLTGGCFPSDGEGNWTVPWASEIHPKYYASGEKLDSDSQDVVHTTTHIWLPGDGNKYYGMEARLDVYGFALESSQVSEAGIWIINRGDGQTSSMNGIMAGWHIWPSLYKDSQTHFFTSWTSAGADKDCKNMRCPGFQKTSTSITPGDVISPVSDINGNKQSITLRLFKDKSTGNWHIHYGFNGAPKPVGYIPKSLLPGLIDKPVEIIFGGYVYHRKPQPSPPMGSGIDPINGKAASFSSLKLIDEDGNDHAVNTDLPLRVDNPCYGITNIVSDGYFYYGGPSCVD
ncbi:hypothetical protein EJB05_34236, partial [Eragrostis curvula]